MMHRNEILPIHRTISIAPMMDATDRHYRYFARLLSKNILLYSEMLTTQAILNGDRERLLGHHKEEHPVALQLGGSDPVALAECAKIGESYGYNEINLNVGCPSDRVQSGLFGVCLMKKPELVAACISSMRQAVSLPVTVKTRIGVDDADSYPEFVHFIRTVANAGCQHFIVHARKAWLNGLSPKENRDIPPLRYDFVYQLKRDFNQLHITLNGGVKTLAEVSVHLTQCDGVMIGREAYSNPWLLVELEALLTGQNASYKMRDIVMAYLPYVAAELAKGTTFRALTRFLLGLFRGLPGAKSWRRHLSERPNKSINGLDTIRQALDSVESS